MSAVRADDSRNVVLAPDRRPAAPPPWRTGEPMYRRVVFVALLALVIDLLGGILLDRQVEVLAQPR